MTGGVGQLWESTGSTLRPLPRPPPVLLYDPLPPNSLCAATVLHHTTPSTLCPTLVFPSQAAALELRVLSSGALLRELPLPGPGSVSSLSGDRKATDFFFSFTDFVEPGGGGERGVMRGR